MYAEKLQTLMKVSKKSSESDVAKQASIDQQRLYNGILEALRSSHEDYETGKIIPIAPHISERSEDESGLDRATRTIKENPATSNSGKKIPSTANTNIEMPTTASKETDQAQERGIDDSSESSEASDNGDSEETSDSLDPEPHIPEKQPSEGQEAELSPKIPETKVQKEASDLDEDQMPESDGLEAQTKGKATQTKEMPMENKAREEAIDIDEDQKPESEQLEAQTKGKAAQTNEMPIENKAREEA